MTSERETPEMDASDYWRGSTDAAIKTLQQQRAEDRADTMKWVADISLKIEEQIKDNQREFGDQNKKLDQLITKATIADGRSQQRTDDTAKLVRRVSWLFAIATILSGMIGLLIESHVHFSSL